MEQSFFYNACQYPRSEPFVFDHEDDPTQQHQKDDCDLNKIVARIERTGVVPPELMLTAQNRGVFGDFSDIPDFQTAQQQMIKAEENFGKLPAQLRDRFNHDPGELLKFIENPLNKDEGIRIGLFSPDEPIIIGTPVPPVPTIKPGID